MKVEAEARQTGTMERRWVRRFLARLSIGFRERGRTSGTSTLYELSTNGCKVKLGSQLVAGQHVWIKLPTLESWAGRVAWSDGIFAGIEFDRPLHPAVSTLIVQRAVISARFLSRERD